MTDSIRAILFDADGVIQHATADPELRLRTLLGFVPESIHYELGVRKPDPRYFEAIVETLPFAPQDMLFIDDNEPNVKSARTLGLSAAHFVHDRSPAALPALEELLESFSVSVAE